jgi:DNA-binding NtrC family response regulator
MTHDWPGNVREIRNAADRFVLEVDGPGEALASAGPPPPSLAQQMDLVEKALIEQALRQCQGRMPRVMEALAIPKKTLYDKLHRHNIDPERFR